MSSATQSCEKTLLAIKRAGVSVWPGEDGKLCIWGADKLTPEQLDYLRQNKATVLAYLRRRNADLLPPNEVCEAWRRRYANSNRNTWR
jgi:hypothetical protein